MKSLWERPPAFFDADPETSEYMRNLHETLFGTGIGGQGKVDAHNMAIEEAGVVTRSGRSPLLTANPTSGVVSTTGAGVPLQDVDVESDGIVLGSEGAGAVGTSAQASPYINHRLTADYEGTEHFPADDTAYYNPLELIPTPENVAAGEAAAGKMWSVKKVIDYVANPEAPPEIDATGDVSSDRATPAQKLTINPRAVTSAKFQAASAPSVLFGKGDVLGTGDFGEIILGAGLSMTGSTLAVTTGVGVGDVVGPGLSVVGNIPVWNNITGTLLADSGVALADVAMDADLHAAVTLDANADTLLSLTTQALGLDTQVANRVLAGPTTGADAVPTFRALVAGDIPALAYQASDAGLTSLAALPTVADRIAYSTAADVWAETPLTAFARTILDDADAATVRATIGAGTSSVTDHGALTGLTDDDHSIYALLAGRAGGQVLIGGTAAGDDLTLRATAGVGAGSEAIIFQGGNNGGTAFGEITATGLSMLRTSVTTAGGVEPMWYGVKTRNPAATSSTIPYGMRLELTTLAGNAQTFSGASAGARIQNVHAGDGVMSGDLQGLHIIAALGNADGTPTGTGTITGDLYGAIIEARVVNNLVAGTAVARVFGTRLRALQSTAATIPFLAAAAVEVGHTAGTTTLARALRISGLDNAGTNLLTGGTIVDATMLQVGNWAAGPTYTNPPIGIDIVSQTAANAIALRQVGSDDYNLFGGLVRIGSNVTPTVPLDVTGAALFSSTIGVTTSVTTPLLLGGTATTQDLTLQTTSGVGAAGADMHFLVGSNGGTEAITILNSGLVGINQIAPSFGRFEVKQATDSSAGGIAVLNSAGTRAVRLWVDSSDVSRLDAGGTGAGTLILNGSGGAGTTNIGGVLQLENKITEYNNIATVSNGVRSLYAEINATAQAAAISGATLYTPPTAGMYCVTFTVTLTQAATVSSVLGGTSGIRLLYTSGDGATAKTQFVPMFAPGAAGAQSAVANTNTNTIGDTLIGSVNVYSGANAMTYSVDYTSVGAPNAMQYAVRVKVERL